MYIAIKRVKKLCGILRLFPFWTGALQNARKKTRQQNRILQTGESQRKDGRYAYKDIDMRHMGLSYYAHATYESAKVEFDRIMGGKQAVNN